MKGIEEETQGRGMAMEESGDHDYGLEEHGWGQLGAEQKCPDSTVWKAFQVSVHIRATSFSFLLVLLLALGLVPSWLPLGKLKEERGGSYSHMSAP